MTRVHPARIAAAAGLLLLLIGAALGGAYGLSLSAIHRSDQQWCALLALVSHSKPRPTPGSRQFHAAVADLERRFGC